MLRLNFSFPAKFKLKIGLICPVFNKIQFKHLFIFRFFRRIQFKHLFIFHFSSRFNSKVDSLFCFPTKFNSKIYSKYWNWLYSIQWNIHSIRKPGYRTGLPWSFSPDKLLKRLTVIPGKYSIDKFGFQRDMSKNHLSLKTDVERGFGF